MNLKKKIIFHKISFFQLNYNQKKKKIEKGGLLVIPSGPGLATIDSDQNYFNALRNSDIALFDSGYFCLLLRTVKFISVKKFSGYKFIRCFLNDKSMHKKKILFVEPNEKSILKNKELLKKLKFTNTHHYLSPIYDKQNIKDIKLKNLVKKLKPKYVVINLGGNVQEVLGYYLKRNLNNSLSIICSGAAIAFLNKTQAPINDFYDKIYLGWLMRIIFKPNIFLVRYLKAFKLFFLVLKSKIIVKQI